MMIPPCLQCNIIIIFCACVVGCTVAPAEIAPTRVSKARELVDLGTWFLRKGDLSAAQAAFTLSLESAATAPALDGLGCVAFRSARVSEAELFFARAIDLDPDYGRAKANLALLYEQLGRTRDAEELYGGALGLSPEDPYARNNFGVFLADTQNARRGLFELKKAGTILSDGVIQKNIATVEEMP